MIKHLSLFLVVAELCLTDLRIILRGLNRPWCFTEVRFLQKITSSFMLTKQDC